MCSNEKELSFQKYIKNIKNGNYYSCSSKCAQEKVKKTNLEKFGEEYYMKTSEYKERVNNSDMNKYGCHHTQDKLIKEKQKKTNIKKYGVENVFSSEKIKNKIKKTNIKKYGVENPSCSNEIKNKLSIINKKIWINKILKDTNVLKIHDNDIYELNCDANLNHTFKIHRNLLSCRKTCKTILCTICNPIKSNIGLQSKLNNFIKNLELIIKYNDRTIIKPLELDIYIPEMKIAFEFNDVYWHNELHKENNYHLNKTEECEKQGIQLIHIWEDDWIYKQDIVKSMILNKLNKTNNIIFARKTEVKEITDNKLIRSFLNNNHLQGFVGSKVKLGLFFNDELVSLMTFGKRRIAMGKKSTNDDEYELLRFCNKLNTNIVGGASKLFKYFIRNYSPKEITTYADRSHSNGNLYKTLGFDFVGKTTPNYYYVIDGIKKHRFNYRKNVLVKEGYNINKTEHQIMIDRKIFRIYDSGNLKFIFKIK